jgi:hypothetical protein
MVRVPTLHRVSARFFIHLQSTSRIDMTPLERLRLAVAVGHAVHGAELRLHTDSGDMFIVSTHPAASIDPCAMRGLVAASASPAKPDVSEHIVSVELTGAVVDAGGGVYRVVRQGHEQRWIPSLLHTSRLAELLDPLRLDGVTDDDLHATLKSDAQLGVTLVVLTTAERYVDRLDEAAEQAAAAIAVEELRCAVAHEIALSTAIQHGDNDGAH